MALWAVMGACLAHEIPGDIRIQALIRAEQQTLQLLVRVPLAAMREIDLPLRGPGYLELERIEPALRKAADLWLRDQIQIREGVELLAPAQFIQARISLASDKSFETLERARLHLASNSLGVGQDLYWNQQYMDVHYRVAIRSDQSRFAVRFAVDRLGLKVVTALRFSSPGRSERAFSLAGDAGWVELDPGLLTAAKRFVLQGFEHILSGVDHLLFLACLMLPIMRLRALIWIVSGFTLAHSITLCIAALGWVPHGLWFIPAVEFLIALSVLFMAIDSVFKRSVLTKTVITFGFGLIHGLGFSFALQEQLQFAGDHLVVALLSFNIGVELGQLLVLLIGVPIMRALFARMNSNIAMLLACAAIGHTAWHWVSERWDVLAKFLPW